MERYSRRKLFAMVLSFFVLLATSCSRPQENDDVALLEAILQEETTDAKTKYSVANKIATQYLQKKQYDKLILFLQDYVLTNPKDEYNAYWLLMMAFAYLQQDAKPVAEYYMEDIIQNYADLVVQGKSVHYLCLQNLMKISENPQDRIYYLNQLITRFKNLVNVTELYAKCGYEYETLGEWELALKSFSSFLAQEDASTIVIQGLPDAYSNAKKLLDFNKSSKDWTFATMSDLENAVRKAIEKRDWKALDSYKSKVNFFAMSWAQEETDTNAQEHFSMRYFMRNKITCSPTLDEASSPNEVYLKSKGWSVYMPVWYLYFRKINFPIDPEIHGKWEWAGIYFGEKL